MTKSLSDGRGMLTAEEVHESRCARMHAPRLGSQARARDAGSWPTPHRPEQQTSALGAMT